MLTTEDEARLRALLMELTNPDGSRGLPSPAREAEIVAEMERLSPDPEIMDHVFWPHGVPHPPGAPDHTVDEIIERVRRYRPIAL